MAPPPAQIARFMERNEAAAQTWFAHIDGVTPLLRNRSLLWQFIQRNVELRHKGSHLGLIWSVLNPLLMLGLYVIVFAKFKDPSQNPLTHALSIFVGLSLFHFLAEVLGLSPVVILSSPNFVKKVVFPLEILPAAHVGAAFFHFSVSIGLALIGIGIWGPGFGWQWLYLPIVLFPLLLTALGIAWATAAIGVFFRDVVQFTNFLSLALMFASAVFYPASVLKENALLWQFFRINPLLHLIELARDCVIRQQTPDLASFAYVCAIGLASCIGGYWTFQQLRPSFADVL